MVEAISIAVDAYIYGYPLVTFDMARKQQTNVATLDASILDGTWTPPPVKRAP